MTEYRKKRDGDTWHWCKNCTGWVIENYETIYEKPTSGELCNQCKIKEKNRSCQE